MQSLLLPLPYIIVPLLNLVQSGSTPVSSTPFAICTSARRNPLSSPASTALYYSAVLYLVAPPAH